MVTSLNLPVLFIDAPANPNGIPLAADQLLMDSQTGITQFVNGKLLQGKRRIGFIGNYGHCQSFFERYTAFRCTMLLAGVAVEDRFILKTNSMEEMQGCLSAMKEFPEVFICANDFIACDAIRILQGMGKTVPDEIGICGFDDAPESRMLIPPLTTIHIHTQIMAFSAMELLMARMKEPSLDYRTVRTETELIYRASTGLSPQEK